MVNKIYEGVIYKINKLFVFCFFVYYLALLYIHYIQTSHFGFIDYKNF